LALLRDREVLRLDDRIEDGRRRRLGNAGLDGDRERQQRQDATCRCTVVPCEHRKPLLYPRFVSNAPVISVTERDKDLKTLAARLRLLRIDYVHTREALGARIRVP
jgi:hypothetical protein